MYRTGLGYDLHRLAEGRRLVLGGLEIPWARGLAGHSDGDALVHAIIDALLGAMGDPDIGHLFPDSDGRYKDVRSVRLLEEVMARVRSRGMAVVNVDATIVAEAPLMAPFIPGMKKILAPVLGLEETALGLKAKTNEGMGEIGRGEAIACWAVVLLRRDRGRDR